MRKIIFLAWILAVAFAPSPRAWTQNSGPQESPTKQVQQGPPGLPGVLELACRLNFSVNELEDGKKINTRAYSMNITAGSNKELKIGTRVPVDSEPGKYQYLDVGTNLRAHIYGKPDSPILDVTADVSNFASPDQNTRSSAPPLLRQMVISGSTLLIFDKPIVIGTVDDPNSKRQFQLEVTVTKLR